jgi:hypothetical protein
VPKRSRCGDCGVAWNGYHHPGCDLETCAHCRRQRLSCGCEEPDGYDDLDDLDDLDGAVIIPLASFMRQR